MKVALINPKMFIQAYRYFPIGLGYIAAALENEEISYSVYDLHLSWQNNRIFLKSIFKNIPDIFAITGLLTSFQSVRSLCGDIKKKYPDSKIVLGGKITVMPPEFVFENIKTDFIIQGEGEKSFIEFLNEFQNQQSYKKIEGLSYIDSNNRIQSNGEASPIENINLYKVPYHKFEMAKYIRLCNIQSPNVPSINLISSRGCPFSCTFCNNSKGNKPKMRFYDVATIEENLDYMISRFNLQHVTFNDDIFTVNKNHMQKICEVLKRKNLSFSLSTRLDFLNKDSINMLEASGCHYLCVGIESPAPKVAKIIDKRLNLDKFEKNIALLKKSKIVANYGFMIGYLGETEETIQQTRDFVLKNKIIYSAFFANAFPRTKLYDLIEDKIKDEKEYLKKLFSVDLSRDYLINMSELSKEKIFSFRDQLVADSVLNSLNIKSAMLKSSLRIIAIYYLSFMRKYGLNLGIIKRTFEFINISIIKPLAKKN